MLAQATEWTDWLPAAIALAATIVAILFVRWYSHRNLKIDASEATFRAQLTTAAIVLAGLLAIIFVLPESTDSELAFSVVGLVVTGALAISSQSIIANAMSGLMLRSVSSFKPGDFIAVAEQMGRVTERGLFHTEIQTADRDLVTIPNSIMMNQPVRVVRSSGTIVSASVSIGYDVSRHTLETLFIEAAEAADLVDPFVQVIELGNYAVSYRVAGFLADPRSLLAARSRLRGAILDHLSGAGIEIMSPMFVAGRSVGVDPQLPDGDAPAQGSWRRPTAEDRVFDKAERAGRLEEARSDLVDAVENLELLRIELSHADDETRPRVESAIRRNELRIERLQRRIEHLSNDAQSSD